MHLPADVDISENNMPPQRKTLTTCAAIAISALSLSGCATTDYVDEAIAGVNARIATVEASAQQANAAAAAANSAAQAAGAQAQQANQRIDQLTGRVDAIEQRMTKRPRN